MPSLQDANGNVNADVGSERAFYNGGVLIEKTRGPATTRSYIFKVSYSHGYSYR